MTESQLCMAHEIVGNPSKEPLSCVRCNLTGDLLKVQRCLPHYVSPKAGWKPETVLSVFHKGAYQISVETGLKWVLEWIDDVEKIKLP